MMYRHSTVVMWGALSLLLLSTPGCSNMKWFNHGSDERSASGQSDGELRAGQSEVFDSEHSMRNDKFSSLGKRGHPTDREGDRSGDGHHFNPSTEGSDPTDPDGGRLSGLYPVQGEHIASEEQLSRSRIGTLLQSSDQDGKMSAELKREEAAAMAAGLQDVFYRYNRWTIEDEGMEALAHNAEWLRTHPAARLRISGHCDERGSHDYNLTLGEKRALAAQHVLVELGVNPQQVSIVSYGKDRPFCREHDDACYQANRRGHMLLNNP